MKSPLRALLVAAVVVLLSTALGSSTSMAQSRAHVYLLRGLFNVFSLGMDTIADQLTKRGIHATVNNYSDWQSLADAAVVAYKSGREGPIILIGHSLGADAVMEMADYLGQKGVPVALAVPIDGTASFATPRNVGRLFNVTQRSYAHMARGPGFHGSLVNLDVSSDPSITHTNIDKSPRLQAQVISQVLAVAGRSRRAAIPAEDAVPAVKPGKHAVSHRGTTPPPG